MSQISPVRALLNFLGIHFNIILVYICLPSGISCLDFPPVYSSLPYVIHAQLLVKEKNGKNPTWYLLLKHLFCVYFNFLKNMLSIVSVYMYFKLLEYIFNFTS